MPTLDYNPDKERHVDHKFIVNKATKDPDFKGVQTSKGFLKFGKDQAFYVKDPALAREVMQEVGYDATVSRVRAPSAHDKGHRYHFGQMPEMPWKKKEREEQEARDAAEKGNVKQDSEPQHTQAEA
jgi:hypothetical protein